MRVRRKHYFSQLVKVFVGERAPDYGLLLGKQERSKPGGSLLLLLLSWDAWFHFLFFILVN